MEKKENKQRVKRLSFNEFVEYHSKLWPQVNYEPGSVGYVQLMRIWNSLAFFGMEVDGVWAWVDDIPEYKKQ